MEDFIAVPTSVIASSFGISSEKCKDGGIDGDGISGVNSWLPVASRYWDSGQSMLCSLVHPVPLYPKGSQSLPKMEMGEQAP